MNTLRLALVALACSVPMLVSAQWIWVEKDGRKVFSDRPPPIDVQGSRILKQPGVRGGAPVESALPVEGAVARTDAAPLKLAGKDSELEAKKKQALAAEADKQKAEDERVALARQDNCSRAKKSKLSFDSGLRVARVNDKGEREFLDDKQREAEGRKLDAVIARDCI